MYIQRFYEKKTQTKLISVNFDSQLRNYYYEQHKSLFVCLLSVHCKEFGTCQIRELHGIEPQKSQEWAALSVG